MEKNQNTSVTHTKSLSNIWIGLIFIFGGAVVLLNQMGILPFELNWWALFILFPALVGLFMLLLSVSLLVGDAINLNLKVYWPIILIVLGLGLIIGRGRRS